MGRDNLATIQKGGKYAFDRPMADGKMKKKSFREVLLTRAQNEFMKLKILDSKNKDDFEKFGGVNSYEWKRLDVEEKIKALPPKDSPEVN